MRYMLDTDIASYMVRSESSVLERRLETIPLNNLVLFALTKAEIL